MSCSLTSQRNDIASGSRKPNHSSRYTCSDCLERFPSAFSLRRHEKRHPNINSLQNRRLISSPHASNPSAGGSEHVSDRRSGRSRSDSTSSSTGADYGALSPASLPDLLQFIAANYTIPSPYPPNFTGFETTEPDSQMVPNDIESTILDPVQSRLGRHFEEGMIRIPAALPLNPLANDVPFATIEEIDTPELVPLQLPQGEEPKRNTFIELSLEEESSYFPDIDCMSDTSDDDLSSSMEDLGWENCDLFVSPLIRPISCGELPPLPEVKRESIMGWIDGIDN